MKPSIKLTSLPALLKALSKFKRDKKRIVFTNGCFDILHVGHVRYLSRAKQLGDILVVALNTDSSVHKIKGPSRPVTQEKDRAEVLSSLACVDYVLFFNDSTPEKLIHAIRPDVLVKVGDWKVAQIAGGPFVKKYGGLVKSLPFYKGFSTTGLIEKIRKI
jgi:D-beta-D-heptose 7-phosphate kinase/D-beta-D-heptose 1-phosphate adenosyltransferase